MTISTQSLPANSNSRFDDGDNPIINADMKIAQAGASFAGIAAGGNAYPVDGVNLQNVAGGAVITAKQTGDHPILTFGKCVEFIVTTADAAVAAADLVQAYIPVEGNDLVRVLNNSTTKFHPFCLSFWAKHNLGAGAVTLPVTFASSNQDLTYPSQVILPTANVWTYCCIPILQGSFITTGTWNLASANLGAMVMFGLMTGSNFTGAVIDDWDTTGTTKYTAGGTNICGTINNFLRITDVKLEHGTLGTVLQRKSFGSQLQQCKRYYWQTFSYGITPVQNSGITGGSIIYSAVLAGVNAYTVMIFNPVEMRAPPTITTYSPSVASANWLNNTSGVDSGVPVTSITAVGGRITNPQVAADNVGNLIRVHLSADARL